MKRLSILLVVAMLTSSTIGCGCFRRLRDRLNRGAFCGPAAAVTAPVAYAAAPAPAIVPQAAPAPVVIPHVVPTPTHYMPCDPCCPPCYTDPCCCPDPCGGYGFGGGSSGYYDAPVVDSGWATGCNRCNESAVLPQSVPVTPAPTGVADPSPISNE